MDLLLVWPVTGATQEFLVECKVVGEHDRLESVIAEGVEQTAAYAARCAAQGAHLVIFDRRAARSWAQKVFQERRRAKDGTEIDVWGM